MTPNPSFERTRNGAAQFKRWVPNANAFSSASACKLEASSSRPPAFNHARARSVGQPAVRKAHRVGNAKLLHPPPFVRCAATALRTHVQRLSQRSECSQEFSARLQWAVRRSAVSAPFAHCRRCANACSETLFGSLKVERLYGQRFVTRRQAKDEVIAWLLWYNQARLHSTLSYVSPVRFEQDWLAAQAKQANS